MEVILESSGICAGYGRIHVLDHFFFSLRRGEVLGIIGPNGSGKTTLINALAGTIIPTEGSIVFGGKNITKLSPDARCRLGIARTFQVPHPFEKMTVFENVLTAAAFGCGGPKHEIWAIAEKAIADAHLEKKRDTKSGELMLLDRKRLEIARAISTKPRLILLDEIAAGLTSMEITEILEIVNALKTAGYTILWIEHIIDIMLKATDRLICMAEGRNVVSGLPAEVLHSKEVEELYLGRKNGLNMWKDPEGTDAAS